MVQCLCVCVACIDSFRPRRDSHNHQPRVKPTSFRVSLKTRTLIRPTVNTPLCDWWPWETRRASALLFRAAEDRTHTKKKRGSRTKSRGKPSGVVDAKKARGVQVCWRREEEEDRCTRLCTTDVETSPVSVEGKRKFAGRQVGLAVTYVQPPFHISLQSFTG